MLNSPQPDTIQQQTWANTVMNVEKVLNIPMATFFPVVVDGMVCVLTVFRPIISWTLCF